MKTGFYQNQWWYLHWIKQSTNQWQQIFADLLVNHISSLLFFARLVTNSNTVVVPNESTASEETVVSNSSQPANNIEPVATTSQTATIKLQASKYSNQRSTYKFQNASIAIAEPTRNNSIINKQAIITNLPSSYNNPMTIDAAPTETNSIEVNTEPTIDEKVATSYEVIDTEDPNRTIFIANFEIDGNKFRGLKTK